MISISPTATVDDLKRALRMRVSTIRLRITGTSTYLQPEQILGNIPNITTKDVIFTAIMQGG